ncbi:hypothetical protein [Sporosarcina psychrophila]|uniref:hypothetical protein n=1 Tax=Sporosarcina psychrophila TaxID=1476 RepID=UPI00078B67B4|nr:hypothetical protein [Sporosarcina psychrophila]AMQ05225.1 hypothetical protein AZE41_04330 [Sporosarcina psychrophila]
MKNKYLSKRNVLMGIFILVGIVLAIAIGLIKYAFSSDLERVKEMLSYELAYIAPIVDDTKTIDVKRVKKYEGISSYEFQADTLTNNEGAVPNEIGVNRIKGILHENDEGERVIVHVEETDSKAPLYVDENYGWLGLGTPIAQENDEKIEVVKDQVSDEIIMLMLDRIADAIDDDSVMVSQIKTTKELKGTLTYSMEAFTDYYGTIEAVMHVANNGYPHLEYVVADYDIDDPDYTNRKNLLSLDGSYRVSVNNGKTPEQTQRYTNFD